jgi:LacI family transcriptional regulator
MIDVARSAGVSIATVSAFINGTSNVSAELTRRIEAAISEIGYERNAIARSLKTGATRTVGLMVADIRNPFFTDVVASIQKVLNRAGYAVMLCSNEEDTAMQDEQIKLMLDRMVDGLIIDQLSARARPSPHRISFRLVRQINRPRPLRRIPERARRSRHSL